MLFKGKAAREVHSDLTSTNERQKATFKGIRELSLKALEKKSNAYRMNVKTKTEEKPQVLASNRNVLIVLKCINIYMVAKILKNNHSKT